MGIRVLHVGLGPIGAGVVRQVAERKGLTIVGGVDVDPAKSGRDLGDVVGLGRRLKHQSVGRLERNPEGEGSGRRPLVHELIARCHCSAD